MGRRAFTGLSLWFTSIAVLVLLWLIAPTYVSPFYNHPIARLLILLVFLAHTCACLTYSLAELLHLPSFLRFVPLILCILTTLTMFLLPTLGPAVIAIAQATANLPQ
ncbi:MAG: hypothetical protein K2W95_14960 [Candidatus Obscuribacterales bacterium]|nr:hypothetical protein [Candidatus Obscuribacterales bacterium]